MVCSFYLFQSSTLNSQSKQKRSNINLHTVWRCYGSLCLLLDSTQQVSVHRKLYLILQSCSSSLQMIPLLLLLPLFAPTLIAQILIAPVHFGCQHGAVLNQWFLWVLLKTTRLVIFGLCFLKPKELLRQFKVIRGLIWLIWYLMFLVGVALLSKFQFPQSLQ